MKRRTKRLVVFAGILVLVVCSWFGLALFRMYSAHASLCQAVRTGNCAGNDSDLETRFGTRPLWLSRSLGPFLKKPFRLRVNLYYPNHDHSDWAYYATLREDGKWYVKFP